MNILLILALIVISFGAVLLFLLEKQKKGFGALTNTIIYHDTQMSPGQVLYAKSINLKGKPDYLIKKKDNIIPVEVKRGSKTPREAYENHTMQLMAYCLLVEENYHIRPPGGIIKYREKEFPIAYTKEAEKYLRLAIQDMTALKQSGIELHCKHPEHNR